MFTEHVQNRVAKRDATRQKVLASAERLFREQGFDATTIRQIAAEAQVSTGTVMAVGDKHALLIAIFDGWIAAVHRGRDAGSQLPPTVDVDEALGLFETFLDYFDRDPALSREYAATIVRGAHESAIFQSLALSLIAELGDALERAGLTRADAGTGARVVYFAYLGILMSQGGGAFGDQTPLDQLRDVVHFVVSRQGGQP